MKTFKNFQEFWPFYLSQHSKPVTRVFHLAGLILALSWAAVSIAVFHKPAGVLWSPILGYGLAWYSHFFIERNRPATFRYPLWSLLGDFKMAALMISGKL